MFHRSTRSLAVLGAAFAIGASAPEAQAAPDPMLDDQWGLTDAATGAPQAWTQSRGDGILVAVLDSGVQLHHPDLANSLWRNAAETPANGVDDDRNGYVDDVHGANITAVNGNVEDDNGHGTHVAGIVAAQAGNGTGGSGIAPGAKIMSVKVLDANRAGDSSQLAKGIRYAVDQGAKILNVSINGDGTTPDLDQALTYAGRKGATIVASAGNNGRDIDLAPSYPASSAEPAVLTVTAIQPTGSLLGIANRGLRSIDLAAPGGHILSTARGSGYELREGTSMAAAFVSGSLALLAAARPDLAQPALRDALVQSAPKPKHLAGLLEDGALNVAAALRTVLPGDMWQTRAAALDSEAGAAAAVSLKVSAARRVRAGRSATVRWTISGADERVVRWRVLLNGKRIKTLAGTKSRLRKRVNKPGTHRWKVVGLDADGGRVVAAARRFKVLRGN
ncbi:MAG TPA: S8 family peptidase [Solirubrobacteraceae bacterium]|nr:S8 family peptidase [Solirubrobacteraceae bacterium]